MDIYKAGMLAYAASTTLKLDTVRVTSKSLMERMKQRYTPQGNITDWLVVLNPISMGGLDDRRAKQIVDTFNAYGEAGGSRAMAEMVQVLKAYRTSTIDVFWQQQHCTNIHMIVNWISKPNVGDNAIRLLNQAAWNELRNLHRECLHLGRQDYYPEPPTPRSPDSA